MAANVVLAERAMTMARTIPAGPSHDRAMKLARGTVALLPNPADRSRILG
jgi:hypothetical protein